MALRQTFPGRKSGRPARQADCKYRGSGSKQMTIRRWTLLNTMRGGSARLPSQTPPPSHPGRWEDLTTTPCSYAHRAAAANPSPALLVRPWTPGGGAGCSLRTETEGAQLGLPLEDSALCPSGLMAS